MRLIYFRKELPLLLLGIIGFFSLRAQDRNCGSDAHMDQLLKDPKFKQDYEKRIRKFELLNRSQAQSRSACSTPIVLPVAVHFQNVSNPDINCLRQFAQNQINVLNADFQATNFDISSWSDVASATFPGVQLGEACIEFCLASQNHPAGSNISNGELAVTVNQTSGDSDFDWSGYLNIFVKFNTGVLGYSPVGGRGNGDGVVIDANAFGTGAGCGSVAPNPAYNLGRTLTHEMGHYLLLDHIWGGGCSSDDGVADTPDAAGSNFGCPSLGSGSCGSADLHMNYMDYTNDECMYMFSAGQVSRMENYMNSNLNHVINKAISACGAVNPPSASCTDNIQNGNETGIDCGGPDCSPCQNEIICDEASVTVKIVLDNYGSETSWTLKESNGNVIARGGPYGNNLNGQIIEEKICVVRSCFDFTINDSYGDGLCCEYGVGSYQLLDDNASVLISGGSFGFNESQSFCLGTAAPSCNDGIQNGNETGVDCGGNACSPCPSCQDGIQNGEEEGVDCGGPDCSPCADCTDGIQNGDETGIDCGGTICQPCISCTDGIQNGLEEGVDCGGPACGPCNTEDCSQVSIKITLDNYGSEISWYLKDDNQNILLAGGPYQNGTNGSIITQITCLEQACYDFVIEDSYGDGLCCSYGQGSYELSDENGVILASGGVFGSRESSNFCIGSLTENASCTDGIQNGAEMGIDCGGPECAPCSQTNGACADLLINREDFESGWGIWNDRGSDCSLVESSTLANSGSFCVGLRDNSYSSAMTTDPLNLSGYDQISVSFNYVAISMDNPLEDFWLQVSYGNNQPFYTIEEWSEGDEFENNYRYSETVPITGPFSENTRIRFRCDASSNLDWVYIDDVVITACLEANQTTEKEPTPEVNSKEDQNLVKALNLYPNPASDFLNISFEIEEETPIQILISDYSGRQLKELDLGKLSGPQKIQIDAQQLSSGFYFVHLLVDKKRISKKFVISK